MPIIRVEWGDQRWTPFSAIRRLFGHRPAPKRPESTPVPQQQPSRSAIPRAWWSIQHGLVINHCFEGNTEILCAFSPHITDATEEHQAELLLAWQTGPDKRLGEATVLLKTALLAPPTAENLYRLVAFLDRGDRLGEERSWFDVHATSPLAWMSEEAVRSYIEREAKRFSWHLWWHASRSGTKVPEGFREAAEAARLHEETEHFLGARENFLNTLDKDTLDWLRRSGDDLCTDAYNHYGDPARGAWRRQAAEAYPLLSRLMRQDGRVRAAIDAGKPLNDALEAAGFGKALLRRIRGKAPEDIGDAWDSVRGRLRDSDNDPSALDWILDLPRAPKTADGWLVAYNLSDLCPDAAGAILSANDADAMRSVLVPEDQEEPGGFPVRMACTNLADALNWIGRRLAAAVAGRADGVVDRLDAYLPAVAANAFRAPLSEVLETSLWWHDMVILGPRNPYCTMAPIMGNGADMLEWPTLFDDVWTAPNGVTVVCLSTEEALLDEGRRREHCVATYADRCHTGATHIVSVRGARNQPLATAELWLEGGRLREAQFRARRNRTPSKRAREALDAFLKAIESGAIAINADQIAQRQAESTSDPNSGGIGFDPADPDGPERVWRILSPWLPVKRLRRLTLDQFCQRILKDMGDRHTAAPGTAANDDASADARAA